MKVETLFPLSANRIASRQKWLSAKLLEVIFERANDNKGHCKIKQTNKRNGYLRGCQNINNRLFCEKIIVHGFLMNEWRMDASRRMNVFIILSCIYLVAIRRHMPVRFLANSYQFLMTRYTISHISNDD